MPTGGVQGGQVYGATDKYAAQVISNPVSPAQVIATMYHALGLPLEATIHDYNQRPHPISDAAPLAMLFADTMPVKLPAEVGFVEKVTVNVVEVADVTVPTAPSLNTTVLLAAVLSKPKPSMVSVLAFAANGSLLIVTTGTTIATCTAVPFDCKFVVTTAVKLPTDVALVVNVTVSAVAVASVTIPTAPLLNATSFSSTVVLKPIPLIVMFVALAAKLSVLLVTTGLTVANCTAAPLLTPFVVTIPINMSALTGKVVKVTVSEVAVAAVTIPAAPLSKTTMLLPEIVSKPNPWMISTVAVAARSAMLLFTTGAITATWTAAPLLKLFVVTIAFRFPAAVGSVVRDTVRLVSVAAVTVPTAPLSNATVLLPTVGSNPKPLMVRLVWSAPS